MYTIKQTKIKQGGGMPKFENRLRSMTLILIKITGA